MRSIFWRTSASVAQQAPLLTVGLPQNAGVVVAGSSAYAKDAPKNARARTDRRINVLRERESVSVSMAAAFVELSLDYSICIAKWERLSCQCRAICRRVGIQTRSKAAM